MSNIRFFFKLFWIGLAAAAMLLQTCLLADQTQHIENQLFFIFSATVFAYNFANHFLLAQRISWIFGGLTAVFFFKLEIEQQFFLTIPVLLFTLYHGIKLPGLSAGLRSKTGVKNLVIGFVWAAMTVAFPLATTFFSEKYLWWMFCGRWLFVAALALAYDLADVEADKKHGLKTVPVKFGKKTTLILIYILLAGTAVFVSINWFLGFYKTEITAALLFSLIFSGFAIWFLNQKNTPFYWCRIAVDGLMIVQAALVYISE